jgi:hypothetical protein
MLEYSSLLLTTDPIVLIQEIMKQWSHTVFIVVLCSLIPLPSSTPQKTRPKPEPNVDAELQQRRATALSILQSLAIEARSYRDEPLRARVQARIADVIWIQDKEEARALFRRAWDVAEALDEATSSVNAPGRLPTTGSGPSQTRIRLRREILQLVARRDAKLGEEFLVRMTNKDPAEPRLNARPLSPVETAERLMLAGQFLAANNIERALQFADPALTYVSERSISFLVELRDKNAAAADQRFLSLLLNADRNASSDANTVSLLTSYVFTPSVYLSVLRNGSPFGNTYPARATPEINPILRRTFFEVTARILLRPLPQIDESTAGRAGTHFMATRLLPLFQQFAPDLVGPISAQLASMGPEVAQKTSSTGDIALNRGLNGTNRPSFDDELKERLDRARNVDERDKAYAHAAISAADAVDPQARDFVDKIEDTETRKGVKTFVDYMLIRSLIRNKKADEALSQVRKADLPVTLRSQFLTGIGMIFVKNDRTRAVELFNEALANARRLEQTSDQAYLLLALLRQFSAIDRVRTWELVSETTKAANRIADFTGENGQTAFTLEGKFSIRLTTELATPSDLAEVFEQLAQENFYQALDASKAFTGDAPKAIAMIAVGRAVLQEKSGR